MPRSTNHPAALAAVLAIPLSAIAFPAFADNAPSGTLSGSVAVTNDYLFRGISQTNRHPAVQAGVEYDRASGWYVGAWGSNISWLSDGSTPAQPVSSSVELDAYAGWRGNLGSDWHVDAGLYEYYYPGSYPHGYTRPYTLEGYAALGWKTLTLKYSQTFGNLFGIADSAHSGYVDLTWSQPFAPKWQFDAHVGHQNVAHDGAASYSDWKLDVARTFAHGCTLTLGWYDTDARRQVYSNIAGRYLGRGTWVLSLAKAF
jgi:uncharacterized protein (TIGR02001 family)